MPVDGEVTGVVVAVFIRFKLDASVDDVGALWDIEVVEAQPHPLDGSTVGAQFEVAAVEVHRTSGGFLLGIVGAAADGGANRFGFRATRRRSYSRMDGFAVRCRVAVVTGVAHL